MSIILKFLFLGFLGGSFCSATEVEIPIPGDRNASLHSVILPELEEDRDDVVPDKMLDITNKEKNGVTVGGRAYQIYICNKLFKAAKESESIQDDLLQSISKIEEKLLKTANKPEGKKRVKGYKFTLFQGKVYVSGFLGENAPFG